MGGDAAAGGGWAQEIVRVPPKRAPKPGTVAELVRASSTSSSRKAHFFVTPRFGLDFTHEALSCQISVSLSWV